MVGHDGIGFPKPVVGHDGIGFPKPVVGHDGIGFFPDDKTMQSVDEHNND